MRKRCKTCQWWDGVKEKNATGQCLKADEKDSLAEALEVGGYRAILYTHIDFGCVQWERKEKG